MRQRLLSYLLVVTTAACVNEPTPRMVTAKRSVDALVSVPSTAGKSLADCSRESGYFGGSAIADRERWYGMHLRALGERPLCRSSASLETYRLTWLPSFNHSIVVRVERKDDRYVLRAKIESGAGGYDPGHLVRDTTTELTSSDREELARLIEESTFWSLPTTPPPEGWVGVDGAQWILEGIAQGRYHVTDRWSPRPSGADAAYRRLGEWLLLKSGLVSSDLY